MDQAYGIMLYVIGLLTMGGIFAVLSLGLNIQWGFTGLFNAGVAGFFVIGAYTSAILTTAPSLRHLGGYAVERERAITVKDGRELLLRPATADDGQALRQLFHQLPEADVYTRFFRRVRGLSIGDVQHLCNLNDDTAVALLLDVPHRRRTPPGVVWLDAIVVGAGVFGQQLERMQGAVGVAAHHIGECAATVDPELPGHQITISRAAATPAVPNAPRSRNGRAKAMASRIRAIPRRANNSRSRIRRRSVVLNGTRRTNASDGKRTGSRRAR